MCLGTTLDLEELQKEWWNNHSNFLIENTGKDKETVAIYFCSNNLFYPHTKEMFNEYVVNRNRYEWYRIRIKRATKHIFVRDIYKQWYVTGLNKYIPDVNSMFHFLKTECEGYSEIVTVGSSAGGYAATLFGVRLGANIIFSFNQQWDISDSIERDGRIISPMLYNKVMECGGRYEFMNISGNNYDKDSVFYFISNKSTWDRCQYSLVQGMKSINCVFFYTSHHGIPFLKCCLPVILQYNKEKLLELRGKKYNPIFFSYKISGFKISSKFLIKEIWRIIKKRLQLF